MEARLRIAALLLLVVWLAPALAPADAALDADSARRAHRLSTDVMSPFCPGRTLADCPSPDAAALRQELRTMLDAGLTEAEVRAQLKLRYGDAVSGVPRSWFGWVLPAVVLVVGAVGLIAFLRRLAQPSRSEMEPPADVDPTLEAEIDAEFERDLR